MARALLVPLSLLCAACAPLTQRAAAPETPPGREAPAVATTAAAQAGEAQARARYAQAAGIAEQTAALVGGWNGADARLEAARAALVRGAWAPALQDADEAVALAEQALSDHYARLANQELSRSYAYAGLNDAQLLQLRAAEEIMVTGNSRLAYGRLRTLNQQLEKRTRSYTVKHGDSLWVIAARPEVYANGLLWPLIWESNVVQIPNPDRLRRGQVLKLRSHPSADEIAKAVAFARGERERGLRPRIGEIREQR